MFRVPLVSGAIFPVCSIPPTSTLPPIHAFNATPMPPLVVNDPVPILELSTVLVI